LHGRGASLPFRQKSSLSEMVTFTTPRFFLKGITIAASPGPGGGPQRRFAGSARPPQRTSLTPVPVSPTFPDEAGRRLQGKGAPRRRPAASRKTGKIRLRKMENAASDERRTVTVHELKKRTSNAERSMFDFERSCI
jgi:hypothetical protein